MVHVTLLLLLLLLLFTSSSPCIVQPVITLGYNSFGGYECGVLFEKLNRSQPVNKLPAFYGNQMIITAFKTASHFIYREQKDQSRTEEHVSVS